MERMIISLMVWIASYETGRIFFFEEEERDYRFAKYLIAKYYVLSLSFLLLQSKIEWGVIIGGIIFVLLFFCYIWGKDCPILDR